MAFWGLIVGAVIAMIIGFCVGGLDNLRHDQNDDRRSGLGESGSDLRRPIYEGTRTMRRNSKNSRKLVPGRELNSLKKGGWDKMPGQEKADYAVSPSMRRWA